MLSSFGNNTSTGVNKHKYRRQQKIASVGKDNRTSSAKAKKKQQLLLR